MKKVQTAAWMGFAGCLFVASAFAQDAVLSGIVRDRSQASIPDAKVEVRHEATGATRSAMSNQAGSYSFTSLQPGAYTVRVEKQGFKSQQHLHLNVPASTNVRFDIDLELGDVAQSVSVEATAPILSETPENGNQVTQLEFDRLPLIQTQRIRSPAQFVFLTPGVQGTVQANGTDNTSASNHVSIHGANNYTNEYWLDGLQAGQSDTNFNEAAPSVDATREFRVITTQLSPEYGITGAAVTLFTLNSGTNSLHGSAYDYLRNDKLDARSWVAPVRAPLKLNEFGVSAGGPIMIPHLYDGRNKSFFFFSYGGSRKSGANQSAVVQIPTIMERAGDFSGKAPIYDPASATPDGGSRTAFADNRIPTSRLDPAALKIAAYLPSPNTSSGSQNYVGLIGEQLLSPDSYTGKIDQVLTDKQTLSGSVTHTQIPRLNFGSPLPLPLPNGNRQFISSWTGRASHTYAINGSLLNAFYVGFNRFGNLGGPPIEDNDWSSLLGIPNIGSVGFPGISFSDGYAGLGGGSRGFSADQSELVKDVFSLAHGTHMLRFGAEWRGNQINSNSGGNTNGSFAFSSVTTADPSRTSSTGNSFASFLLGAPRQINNGLPSSVATRRQYFGSFVQDEWRATPKLTITYGVRWEFQTAPTEQHNRYGFVDLNSPNPDAGQRPGALIFAGRDGNGSALIGTDYSAIGPRIGVAWRVLPEMVIRAGYGVYYSRNYVGISSPGFATTAQSTSLDGGLTPAGSLSAGVPKLTPVATPPVTALNGQSSNFYTDDAGRMPRTQQWSVGVQRQIGKTFLVEANYVAMHNTRQNAEALSNINQLNPSYLSLGPLLTQSITSPAARQAGIPIPYDGFTGTVGQALRPYPQYQTLTESVAKVGSSFYNAMELHVRKRFGNGLSVDGSYVWSKNTGYPDISRIAFGVTNNYLQDNYNRKLEHGPLPNDVPHAVIVSYVYELPFGGGHRFGNSNTFMRVLTGQWSISAIQRYQSGTPLDVYMTNSLPLFSSVLRPNVVSGQFLQTPTAVGDFNPTVDSRINRRAFSVPAPYTLGSAAPTYDTLRNFAVLQEDVGVTKGVNLSERFQLQFYGQAFNVANRHRFTQFNTNFSSASFGLAGGVNTPRQVQLGVRLRF